MARLLMSGDHMHIERMKLMVTMLLEVSAGTWKPAAGMGTVYSAEEIKGEDLAFNMGAWLEDSPMGTCGFSACAVGHATMDQRFIDMGLHNRWPFPVYMGMHHWDAVEEFFEISLTLALELFSPESYEQRLIKPNDVAERIQEKIDHWQATQGDQP